MSSPSPSATRPPLWSVLIVGAATIGLYAGRLDDFFLSDDFLLLHRASQEPLGLWLLWPDPERSGWFRPLPEMLWRLDYLAGGLHPLAFRLTNLLLHAGNAVLVSWVAHLAYRRIAPTMFAGLLFATLPRATGAVNWLSARYDLVAAFFVLLTVVLAARAKEGRGRAAILAMSCTFAAALMSKEVAYAAPVMLAMLASRRLSNWSGLVGPLVPIRAAVLTAAIAAVFLIVRLSTFHGLGGYGIHGHVSLTTLLRPVSLLPAFWPSEHLIVPVATAGWWIVAGATGGALCLWGCVWLLWLLLALVPAANLMHPTLPFFEFDRFFYLAGAGWAIGLASLSRASIRARPLVHAVVPVLALAVLAGAWQTRIRSRAWAMAADLTWRVQETILREAAHLPDGSALDCSDLPDNISGAYAYRNGCDRQILLAIPGERIRGIRFVPGIDPDPVSAARESFSEEFRFSADGRRLTHVPPAVEP